MFDPFSRGRYSTDASIYQIEPLGVLVPKSDRDVTTAIQIAAEDGVPVLMRGGGTSQCGQTVGRALIIDVSKHLNQVVELDQHARRVTVQPGIVLDELNRVLHPRGLFFPVDVSTANRATIGGMTGNNSCGARSIRYGNMVDNVHAIDAVLWNGDQQHFGDVPGNLGDVTANPGYLALVSRLRDIALRYHDEMERKWPRVQRRVGGYNIDTLSPSGHNMARLLVGSEGTLAAFRHITLDLQGLPRNKVLGVCHFPTFYNAMDAAQHIVKLDPSAVELVDRTMVDLARDIPLYAPTVERFVRGQPAALLLVEFAGDAPQTSRLDDLEDTMSSLGHPDALVKVVDAALQTEIWEVRKAGLNIMMSMKGDGKPVSFIEDCAVALEDLAEYTDRLTSVFEKHGTTGTWYAHASVGCLHVRPVLNMKDGRDVAKMRAIAEEAFAMVREYKGSHSGEHGDGIVRSEFHEPMFGAELVQAFNEVKTSFDPNGVFNPGKIVQPPRMDDRSLFRYKPDYETQQLETALDWSEWRGFPAAVEMCNNNGACRKASPGVMCPSYRATRDEQHATRGRANSLRLALSGQLGPDALVSESMFETMDLCLSCKGCKRECPTGVDMARMKIEFLHHYHRKHPLSAFEKLTAWLPRYAPWAARAARLVNVRNRSPVLARLSEKMFGFSAERALPEWRQAAFAAASPARGHTASPAKEVVLFADTFNTWFEPENCHAAVRVLNAAGYTVHHPRARRGSRPLCCGRTFLSVGDVARAREELERTLEALTPFLERGVKVVGLEPSCLLTFRDELGVLLKSEQAAKLATQAVLFEEFLVSETERGALDLELNSLETEFALVHGHCHQKAFKVLESTVSALRLIPELRVDVIDSGCCGMAGAFGYHKNHYPVSMSIAELDLLPAVREAAPETMIVAGGTSCRHQIRDGSGREPMHVARVLALALQDRSAEARAGQ